MENVSSNPQMTAAPQSQGLSADAMSALSYFCVPAAIIALCLQQFQGDRKVRFNAMQALLFVAGIIVTYIGSGVMYSLFGAIMSVAGLYWIAGVMSLAYMVFMACFGLGIFVTWIVLMVTAANGKALRLPVLGKLADQLSNK